MDNKHSTGRPKKTDKPAPPVTELIKLYYSIEEAAEVLGVHHNTIRKRIKAGQMQAMQVGRQWRIPKEALEFKPTTPGE